MSHSKGTFVLVGIVADATTVRRDSVTVRQHRSAPSRERVQRGVAARHTGSGYLQQVLDLNARATWWLSRDVYLNPPPKSQVLYHPSGAQGIVNAKTAVTTRAHRGMALLEVILLAGPAFRRQRPSPAARSRPDRSHRGRRKDLRN